MKRAAFIALLMVTVSAPAKAQEMDPFHTLYGDGMRLYAESRYPAALQNLYRALAIKSQPNLMRLIVRSHDLMGHCSAAITQSDEFSLKYPKKSPPALQVCATTGELELACASTKGDVTIDGQIVVACGSSILLPPGEHVVESVALNLKRTFTVEADTKTVAALSLVPSKWIRAELTSPSRADFSIIKTPDGMYEIWVRSRDDKSADSRLKLLQ